ncbi:MAG: TrbG/VirB9 family P-type conjugative transfer protein [Bacteroidota bacterium]
MIRLPLTSAALLLLITAAAAEPSSDEAAPAAANPPVQAASLAACRAILLPSGTRETVEAHINVGTRIQFPAAIKTFQVDTPGLWDVSAKEDSLFVRPKTSDANAAATGISVFLVTGRKYDFVARRSEEIPHRCVLVAALPGEPPPGATLATAKAVRPQPLRPVTKSSDYSQIATGQQLAEMRRQIEAQARDRIKEFQYAINTRYAWAGSGKSIDDQNLIDAVYDDGRFTYVRITTSAFGLPAVAGVLGDRDVLLQYGYDDLTGVFTVQGLYDRLRVRLGTHQIDILRQG